MPQPEDKKRFQVFVRKNKGLATASEEEIREEIEKREKSDLIFPLDVFHPKIKPFINALHDHYDIPRSYIGLSMMAAYSTAIGSAYRVTTNKKNTIALAIWACMEGISSSGKSYALDLTHQPLYDIQEDFDRTWDERTREMTRDKKIFENLQTVMYRDAHIATLVRSVMPDNHKGVAKHADEIMEWLNGMNQMNNKEGTDEQFWLSTWNGRAYSGIRSGKDKFVLPRPFVNIVGGIQPTITYKLFAKDRDTTGFIFRLLFAVPEEIKIASPDQDYLMPDELEDIHKKAIRSLYFGLPVEDPYEDPRLCVLNRDAVMHFNEWVRAKVVRINHMQEVREKEIHSGILGKIKEYALRFSAILTISDRAYSHEDFRIEDIVDGDVMVRALKMAEYFYASAVEVYDRVNVSMTAPVEVIRVAALMKMGYSTMEIAMAEMNPQSGKEDAARQKMYRMIKKWIREYPRVFNAQAR